jgi:hypothetical protein
VLFAVAVLIRPMIFVLLPLPYIYLFIIKKDRTERRLVLKNFVFFVSAIILVMLPWWIRNLVTLNQFIPLATQGNPFYAGVVRDLSTLPPSDNEFMDGIRLFFTELFNRPLQTIKWFTIGKLEILFIHPDYWLPPGYTYLTGILRPLHMYIVALGSIGLLGGLFNKNLRMVSIYAVPYIMLSLLFIPVPRFALQYMPLLAIFAAFVIFRVFAVDKSQKKPKKK